MKSHFLKIFNSKIVKNASWIIFGRICQMLISLITGLLTARYLGPSNYGLINYAAAYTGFFFSVCTLGINNVLVKEFIDNPEREGEVLGTSLFLKFISSLLSAGVILCLTLLIDADEPVTILVVALCSIGVIFNIFDVFRYWFQSKLKSKTTAIVTSVAYTITALYKVVLIITGKPVTYFALSTSVDYICIAIMLYVAYKKSGGGKLSVSMKYGKQLLLRSCHFILPGLMISIYAQTDKLMLKSLIGSAEIGFYSTAVTLCNMWCFILSAIIDSMYPSIVESYNSNQRAFDKRNLILYSLVFYISAFVSLVFTVFAEPIVYIIYGSEFMPAVMPLRIITWYTAFSYLGVARNAWIVCKNMQKYLIYIYVGAAVSNVILNLILIPSFGASGAAVASLCAQIITTMVIPLFMKEFRENTFMMLNAITLKWLRK